MTKYSKADRELAILICDIAASGAQTDPASDFTRERSYHNIAVYLGLALAYEPMPQPLRLALDCWEQVRKDELAELSKRDWDRATDAEAAQRLREGWTK